MTATMPISRSSDTHPSLDSVPMALGAGPSVLQQLIGQHTDLEPTAVKTDISLEKLGLDSITAVQLASALFEQLKLQIHPDELFETSLGTLSKHVQPSLALSSHTQQTTRTAAARPSSDTASLQSGFRDPFETLALSNLVYEEAARKRGFENYWSKVSPLQNDILLAYINKAFISLGVDLSEQPYGVEMPRIPHIPKHGRLMKRLLDILETRYIVMQRSGKLLRGSDRIDVHDPSQLCKELRVQHPAYDVEVELLELVGPRLGECLSGKVDPISVLFGNVAARRIMDDFYRGAPMMATHTEQLVHFFITLLKDMDLDPQTPVRILEVGGGTGGTTAPLVEALKQANLPVRYTFTDIGPSFIRKAKTRWASNPWMDFATFNIEDDIPEAFHQKYDIVMGANVVHATTDRTATCRRLRETLRPGGLIVLSELTHVIDWYDICFGLLDGWWLADGGKGYAIQPAAVWMEVFERAGFKRMGHSGGISEEANSQQLLVACTTE